MSAETLKETRAHRREKMLQRVPENYKGWLHAGATTTLCVSMLGAGLIFAQIGTAWQLVAIIPMAIALNLFEWWVHKNLMHKKALWPNMYQSHTKEHHVLFSADDMGIDDPRATPYILIPLFALPLVAAASAVAAIATGAVLGSSYGWLMLGSCGGYILLYEICHWAYHVNDDHWLNRLSFVKRLAVPHTRHHEPRLMQKWNFNITLPLADWIFGTLVSKSRYEMTRQHVSNGNAMPVEEVTNVLRDALDPAVKAAFGRMKGIAHGILFRLRKS